VQHLSESIYIKTFAKLHKTSTYVIPAKAGIQFYQILPRFPRIAYGTGLVKPGMTQLDCRILRRRRCHASDGGGKTTYCFELHHVYIKTSTPYPSRHSPD